MDITQHWHSPTPAGIPVVWRQDTFVSWTITHTLWWTSLNSDTVLHQQESLSFGDRTPLFPSITHTLWWASLNTDTVLHQQESLSFGDRTPLFHELLHILSGGHHSTVTQSYTSRNPCRLETGHLCFINKPITHTLWWASLNTDTVLHQQESLSFGDRTPLFH